MGIYLQVSNIIYLDSPVGVGLSYSKNESDYFTGDQQTALDSHAFLLKVLKISLQIIQKIRNSTNLKCFIVSNKTKPCLILDPVVRTLSRVHTESVFHRRRVIRWNLCANSVL